MHLEILNTRENHELNNFEDRVSSRLLADSQPNKATLADFQPYLPGLHPICSSPLPKLEIGDDAMDHRMAIHSWEQARKAAGCFK